MLINRFRPSSVLMAPEDDGSLGASGMGTDTGTEVDMSIAVDTSAAAGAPTDAQTAAPKTMLEAISQTLDPSTATAAAPASSGQPRDDLGRFTHKNAAGEAVDVSGVKAPDQAAALAAQAAAAAPKLGADGKLIEEDPLKMPEGLSEKGQQRFQTLANTNRELTGKVEHFETKVLPAFEAMHQVWTENQIKPEQFEQATALIGMLNKGDLEGAERVLMEQLQIISLMRGQSAGVVDPLASYPDLRERVDMLGITEADAIELARARMTSTARDNRDRQQQHIQQTQQAAQNEQRQQAQAVETATHAVNDFCMQMKASDLDYGAIESQLLPRIAELVQDVPPSRWAAVVKANYELIKGASSAARRAPSSPNGQPMRPVGAAAGVAKPTTMHEAIWGNRQ